MTILSPYVIQISNIFTRILYFLLVQFEMRENNRQFTQVALIIKYLYFIQNNI